jgi:Toprim domain
MSAARDIAQALAGKRVQFLPNGDYLVPCPVSSHGKGRGDRSPSLSIGDGQKCLLVNCFAGCDSRDVLDELRRRGLLDDVRRRPANNNKRHQAPRSNSVEQYRKRQHEKASWLWSQRRPIAGTIAETYLRSRHIMCPLPVTLAFLPSRKREHDPAMIAAFALCDEPEPGVVGEPRGVNAVHLTLLKPDGSGKAAGDKPKIIVGRPLGRPIVIAPPNDLLALAIGEGIEDALTAHAALGMGAWVAGSADMMPALADKVPDYIEAVTVFAHADKSGQNGARELAKRLHRRGIEIFLEGIAP